MSWIIPFYRDRILPGNKTHHASKVSFSFLIQAGEQTWWKTFQIAYITSICMIHEKRELKNNTCNHQTLFLTKWMQHHKQRINQIKNFLYFLLLHFTYLIACTIPIEFEVEVIWWKPSHCKRKSLHFPT